MEKGIVTSCGNSNTHFLNLNILLEIIQFWGVPIEIFHQNELSKNKIKYIKENYPNVNIINLSFIKDNLKGYQMKPFAIYLSNFNNILWIDNDVVPLQTMSFLFKSNYDAIFWKDKYIHSDKKIRDKYNFSYEYETGVIFLRKMNIIKHLQEVIRMNCNYDVHFYGYHMHLKNFNGNRNKYYKELLGDKDTFQICFQNYDNKYINSQKPHGIGTNFFRYKIPLTKIEIKFPLVIGNFYETGLLQYYNGKQIFLHKTVYENKLGEIFYTLYDKKGNEENSGLYKIEKMSKKMNKKIVNQKYYYYIPYFCIYLINILLNIINDIFILLFY